MINMAVVGAGHWGPNLIRNFQQGSVSQVRWVVDSDAKRLEAVRARFPEIKTTSDAAQVFADKEIEAVVISTPTSTHYALTKAALEAGKHVLVEKPITADGKQGDELVALASKSSRVLMVGHVFLFNPAVQKVRKYIDDGELGRLHYVSMVRTNLGPIRMDVNAAWDLASHDISIANYWLKATPTAVSATGGTWINEGIDDAVFATLKYPGNILVNLHASWLNPRKARDITVVGEKRMLTFDDMNLNEPVRIYDKQVTDARVKPAFIDTFGSFRASVREGDITIPKVAMGEPLRAECDHFVECVREGKAPLTSGRDAVHVVRVLEAITASIKNQGREERVSS
jgi:predicted dehydrogenase